jgi:hypothetical protein
MIIRHDVSNGAGKFDYLTNNEIIARSYGPSSETEEEIESRLGDTIVSYADSDDKANYDASQWSRDRQNEYSKKSPYDQIEMMADGTFNAWYDGIKQTYPKP